MTILTVNHAQFKLYRLGQFWRMVDLRALLATRRLTPSRRRRLGEPSESGRRLRPRLTPSRRRRLGKPSESGRRLRPRLTPSRRRRLGKLSESGRRLRPRLTPSRRRRLGEPSESGRRLRLGVKREWRRLGEPSGSGRRLRLGVKREWRRLGELSESGRRLRLGVKREWRRLGEPSESGRRLRLGVKREWRRLGEPSGSGRRLRLGVKREWRRLGKPSGSGRRLRLGVKREWRRLGEPSESGRRLRLGVKREWRRLGEPSESGRRLRLGVKREWRRLGEPSGSGRRLRLGVKREWRRLGEPSESGRRLRLGVKREWRRLGEPSESGRHCGWALNEQGKQLSQFTPAGVKLRNQYTGIHISKRRKPVIHGYHLIITAYGFWLPNDPRGSWSEAIRKWELARYGQTTQSFERRSLDELTPEEIAQRDAALNSLVYPAVTLSGYQALAVGRGFGTQVAKSNYTVWACSILPEHVHLVIARHTYKVEQIAILLKGAATRKCIESNCHPLSRYAEPGRRPPRMWAEHEWKVYLDSEEAIENAINYVEENPVKEGKPKQTWSFVQPFEGITNAGWTTYH